MNIIEDLYYGNVVPIEKTVAPDSEEKKMLCKIIKQQAELNKTFNDEQKEMFEKYNENQNKLNGIMECNSFCDGFITASKIFIEIEKDR